MYDILRLTASGLINNKVEVAALPNRLSHSCQNKETKNERIFFFWTCELISCLSAYEQVSIMMQSNTIEEVTQYIEKSTH